MEDFRGQRQETEQGGRKIFTDPGRIIVVDPSGQQPTAAQLPAIVMRDDIVRVVVNKVTERAEAYYGYY